MTRSLRLSPSLRLWALDFIEWYKAENGGDSPTIRQIGAALDIPSTCTVSRLLDRMHAFGMIERKGHIIKVYGGYWTKQPRKDN